MSSVNFAGSRGDAPYTEIELWTTSFRKVSAFWHAASSCMVPMTLISFIEERPPALSGAATTARCTTVPTPRVAITLEITGLRMSARMKSALPRSCRGGTTSMPTTSTSSSASDRAKRAPRSRETPVTRTTRSPAIKVSSPGGYLPARRRWIRVRLSSLRCFFFAIRLRRFLMTEPTDVTSRFRDVVCGPGLDHSPDACRRATPACYRAVPDDASQSCSCALTEWATGGAFSRRTTRLSLVTSYIDDISPGSGRRSRPRAWLVTDAPTLSLNGDWKFRWSPVAYGLDDAPADPGFDDSGWDTIPVPSHWVLPAISPKAAEGAYGRPIYTNIRYPFP